MLITIEYDAMFFGNGNIRKEFAGDEHYVGHALNPLAPSSLVVVDYHEGWMVLIHAQDEEHPNPYSWQEHCCHQIFYQLAPIFVKLR